MSALKPCGTIAAYARHITRKEQPCQPCRQANNAYQRAYRNDKDGTKVLKPCGTVAAYVRHRRHGEDPCQECRRAKQREGEAVAAARGRLRTLHSGEFAVSRAEKQPGSPGWLVAMSALVRNHSQQYRALVAECRDELAREQSQAEAS